MALDDYDIIAELVDGSLAAEAGSPPLEARPGLSEEVEIARRVRGLMQQLRSAEIEVPAGFEERLLARVREDETLLDLLDLGWEGFGRALFELLAILFGLLPRAQEPLTA